PQTMFAPNLHRMGNRPGRTDGFAVCGLAAPTKKDPGGLSRRRSPSSADAIDRENLRELGIDVIDDGEYGKPSFVSYINKRPSGYEVDTRAGPRNQWLSSREGRSFPEFYAQTHPASTHTHMICTGPITYKG